jgi:hypothetical protein
MKKISIIGFVIIFLSLTAFSVSAAELGARGYYWFPNISGDVSVSGGSESGTKLDFEKFDMGTEAYPVIEVFAGLGRHHLSFSFYSAEYEGDKTFSEAVNFNGKLFNADMKLDNKIEYTVYDFVYQWDLINLENMLAGGSLGLVGKIKYMDITTSLEGSGKSEEKNIAVPIPMIGVNLHVGVLADILEARVQATGIGFSDSSILEILGDVSYTPFPFMDLHAGYRRFVISIDEDEMDNSFSTSGPYIALTVGF